MKPYDIMLCGAIVLTILLGSSLIPFFGIFLSLAIPQVFLYYGMKLGLRQGSYVAGGAVLVVSAITILIDHVHLIVFCVEYAIVGIFLSECFRREYPFDRIIFLGTVLICAFSGFFVVSMSVLYNISITDLIKNYIDHQMLIASSVYRDFGVSSVGDVDINQYIESLKAVLLRIFPGLITVSVIFVVWMNAIIARFLLRFLKLNVSWGENVRLYLWSAPEWLVWCLIVSGFGIFLGDGWFFNLSLNGIIIILVAYFFNGISIILFYFDKYNVSSIVRVIVYTLIAVQQFFIVLIAFAGIFDQWFDFRKLKRKIDIDG